MQLNVKLIGLVVASLVGVAGLVGGAFYVGKLQTAKAPVAAPQLPAAGAQQLSVPSKPEQAPASAPAGPVQQGQVQVDAAAKFTHFRVGERHVKSMLLDGKVLWVGTSGGLIRYDTASQAFRLFDARDGLLSSNIVHLGKLDGKILAATYGGGLSLYDAAKDSWENFNLTDGLSNAFVYAALKLSNGDIWVASRGGVNRIRGGALREHANWDLYTVESTKGGLPSDSVYGVAEGRNGEVWLATKGGLARYANGAWDHWNHAKGLGAPLEKIKDDHPLGNEPAKASVHPAKPKEDSALHGVNAAYNPNYVVALQVDRAGVVWSGTWGAGLARFDGKSWRNYTVADGLPGNQVLMLHQDDKGVLWIGTNNGLARRDGDKFVVMTTEHGLFSNHVFSMATGAGGDQWIGSFGGVAHLKAGK